MSDFKLGRVDRGGFRGRDDRGQRRQPVAPDHGRGGAGDPDPRGGLRALQPRPGDAGARRSTSRSSTSTCAATAPPTSRCSTTTWRSGPTTSPALQDVLGIPESHIHGTSMGGMIAITFAGKYPERTTSVVINCAAAKLGRAGRLIFKNWIDIAELDPDGPGSRILAELISWQARLEGLPRVGGRPGDRRPLPADPARLEPRRGVHRRLPGHVRHGHHALARQDHVARARARRRRGHHDPVGPGPGRRGPGGRSTRGSRAPRST